MKHLWWICLNPLWIIWLQMTIIIVLSWVTEWLYNTPTDNLGGPFNLMMLIYFHITWIYSNNNLLCLCPFYGSWKQNTNNASRSLNHALLGHFSIIIVIFTHKKDKTRPAEPLDVPANNLNHLYDWVDWKKSTFNILVQVANHSEYFSPFRVLWLTGQSMTSIFLVCTLFCEGIPARID